MLTSNMLLSFTNMLLKKGIEKEIEWEQEKYSLYI